MLHDDLRPFLQGDLLSWRGLPAVTQDALDAALGIPEEHTTTDLGFYAAERYVYPLDVPSKGIIAYARRRRVVLIEAIRPPPASAMEGLPEPWGIKAQEILVSDFYAHEYVYCEMGLVLTVAEPLSGSGPVKLVRCRGIRPIKTVEEFGPEYYKSFEDQVQWPVVPQHD